MSARSKRYGVFDLGSNSIKFLFAEQKNSRLHVLEEGSRATRLAENLAHTGRLSEKAIRRTLSALIELRKKAVRYRIDQFSAVATSAVRDSKNRKKFIKAVEEVLGFRTELISGDEEAEIIFLGVKADPFWKKKEMMVMDVGGGSVEWIEGKGSGMNRWLSLPLGCVRLRERFIKKYPVGEKRLEELLHNLQEQLRPFLESYSMRGRTLVVTGGISSTLAAIHQKLKKFDAKRVDHFVFGIDQVEAILEKLKKLSLAELRKIPGLPAQRADIIIPGTAVVYATMRILGALQMTVSVRGLRYGVLQKMVTTAK